jgi:guanylate kinase
LYGNVYGTSRESIRIISESGRICILELDIQGCRSVKALKDPLKPTPVYMCVQPRSLDVLRKRLLIR